MANDSNILRLELDVTQYAMPGSLVNLFTGSEPILPRARDLRIQIVLISPTPDGKGQLDPDVGNVAAITAELKTYQSPSSAPIASVTTGVINAAMQAASRDARNDQHAVIDFTAGMMSVNMGSADVERKDFSLVITAVRSGKTNSLGWGKVQVLNDGGLYSGNQPTVGDPTFPTWDQFNAVLSNYIRVGENDPNKMPIFVSENGQYRWLIGVDNNGQRIDRVSGP